MEQHEWENEPDEVEFEYLGFKCLILRHPTLKHLRGYVGLPSWHPYYGKDYDSVDYLDVHGGLTYSGWNNLTETEWFKLYGIEPDDLWWVGFDCAHAGDGVPFEISQVRMLMGKYRNIAYVKRELRKLCRQLTPKAIMAREMEKGGEQ